MRFISVICAFAIAVNAVTNLEFDKIVVTQSSQKELINDPSKVEIVGKNTLLEYGDVAKSFLNVTGFSMMRKGGGGSEIFYRSQGGGRLPIMLDGSQIFGGCGGRMDTAITYISPENYRSVRIIKGPQDVRYSSLIAGGVLFERGILRLEKPTFSGNLNALYGSYAHVDTSLNLTAGNELGSLQVFAGSYKSDDYKDALKNTIHSAYERKNASVIATLTPLDGTAVEFSGDFGKGEASYADRGMDGSKFDRRSLGFKLEQSLNAHNQLNFSLFNHKIDHIMDNFSRRPVIANNYRLSNPKREIKGFRVENELTLDSFKGYFGFNQYTDLHKSRMANGKSKSEVKNKAKNTKFKNNLKFKNKAVFVQGEYYLDESGIFGGFRKESVKAYDFFDKVWEEYPLFNKPSHKYTLNSAFLRYEHYLQNATLYAGFGHAQRAPDFWEINKVSGFANNSTYNKENLLRKEQNNQLDIGGVFKLENGEISTNLFYAKFQDYILMTNNQAFNTDAKIYGFEIDASVKFFDILRLGSGLSYTKGVNLKDIENKKAMSNKYLNRGDPLPQIAPLQAKFELGLEKNDWFIKNVVTAHGRQKRVAQGFGNVAGTDLGESKGFATLSLYGGYKYKNFQFLFGAENLTNKQYSYHIAKRGVEISQLDISSSERVYESGRNYWAKFKVHF
ncbi:TonB-dependent receptor domain-containing protein [Campylobacter mucosalis]|uniref:TonB-dependent receptor domain-containing protein n=1 Tax=Campylobacter mucosalis TaxID=202 RepID=UPI0014703E6F|nr:TonB-dependent receptor [Campylobacter mucosalis]